jgi:hypothetical protein
LLTGMTSNSLHMQWPLTSQLHGSVSLREQFFCYGSNSTPETTNTYRTYWNTLANCPSIQSKIVPWICAYKTVLHKSLPVNHSMNAVSEMVENLCNKNFLPTRIGVAGSCLSICPSVYVTLLNNFWITFLMKFWEPS